MRVYHKERKREKREQDSYLHDVFKNNYGERFDDSHGVVLTYGTSDEGTVEGVEWYSFSRDIKSSVEKKKEKKKVCTILGRSENLSCPVALPSSGIAQVALTFQPLYHSV